MTSRKQHHFAGLGNMVCKGKAGFFIRPPSRVKKMPFSLRMAIIFPAWGRCQERRSPLAVAAKGLPSVLLFTMNFTRTGLLAIPLLSSASSKSSLIVNEQISFLAYDVLIKLNYLERFVLIRPVFLVVSLLDSKFHLDGVSLPETLPLVNLAH